jgi:hypothetical protein
MESKMATFLSVSPLSSASSDSSPLRWGCQVPPDPTRSIATLSAGRPNGHSCRLPETFKSGTLLSFYLQGLAPPRDPSLLPDSILPCRFPSSIPEGNRAARLRRFAPPGNRFSVGRCFHRPGNPYPPGFPPLRSSSTTVGSASRPNPPTRFPRKIETAAPVFHAAPWSLARRGVEMPKALPKRRSDTNPLRFFTRSIRYPKENASTR